MATKKTPIKAHRGFIHIRKDPGIGGRPRRRRPIGDPPPRGRRRPPRNPLNPFRPRRPKNIPILDRSIPKRPTTSDVRPAQRMDTTSVRPATRMPTQKATARSQFFKGANNPLTAQQNELVAKQMRQLMQRQLSAASKQNRINTRRARPPKNMGAILRGQQKAADNFKRLRDIAFRRSASAQRRAKGGVMVKPKNYVNPSSTIDKRKKK